MKQAQRDFFALPRDVKAKGEAVAGWIGQAPAARGSHL